MADVETAAAVNQAGPVGLTGSISLALSHAVMASLREKCLPVIASGAKR